MAPAWPTVVSLDQTPPDPRSSRSRMLPDTRSSHPQSDWSAHKVAHLLLKCCTDASPFRAFWPQGLASNHRMGTSSHKQHRTEGHTPRPRVVGFSLALLAGSLLIPMSLGAGIPYSIETKPETTRATEVHTAEMHAAAGLHPAAGHPGQPESSAERRWAQIERASVEAVEGWCAANVDGVAIPQLPVVFEGASGWPAFGGRLTAVKREDVAEKLRGRNTQNTQNTQNAQNAQAAAPAAPEARNTQSISVEGNMFGWRYSLPGPGTYVFFCNDKRIGEASVPGPQEFAAAVGSHSHSPSRRFSSR